METEAAAYTEHRKKFEILEEVNKFFNDSF